MTNKEVRINLLEALAHFIAQNCKYSYQEEEAVKECLTIIEEPNDECEAFNEKNPNHGKQSNLQAEKGFQK